MTARLYIFLIDRPVGLCDNHRMNKQRERAEATRRKLVTAAYQVIRADGIENLSANKIVQTAGVSKGSFFHHFAQMEDLYLEILTDLTQAFDEGLTPEKFDSLEDFLLSASDFSMRFVDNMPEISSTIFFFISQALRNPAYHKKLKTMFAATLNDWLSKVEHLVTPALSEQDLDCLIRIIDMFFAGLTVHHFIFNEPERYRQITKDFAQMVSGFIKLRGKNES